MKSTIAACVQREIGNHCGCVVLLSSICGLLSSVDELVLEHTICIASIELQLETCHTTTKPFLALVSYS